MQWSVGRRGTSWSQWPSSVDYLGFLKPMSLGFGMERWNSFIDHHHHHHFLSRMRLSVSDFSISCSVVPDYCFPLADISILVPAKCFLPFFAYNYWTVIYIYQLSFFFVYLIFVQFISSLFSLIICFGTSLSCTFGFLVCSLNVFLSPI